MDNLLTNKYFCIAILIALIVLIYLYTQKKSCSIEKMDNLEFTQVNAPVGAPSNPLVGAAFDRRNSFDDDSDSESDEFGDDIDDHNNYPDSIADQLAKYRAVRLGQNRKFKKNPSYVARGMRGVRGVSGMSDMSGMSGMSGVSGVPRPLDDRPDLSQCQPCICPQDDLFADDESEVEYEWKYAPKRRKRPMSRIDHRRLQSKKGFGGTN